MRSFSNLFRTFLVFCVVLQSNWLQAQALNLAFSGVNPSCHTYTNGIATVTVTGGSGNYAYRWDNGQAGASNYGLPAGNYYVTVTDQTSGWVGTGSTALTHPPQVALTINPVNANCGAFNGNLTTNIIGGTGAFTYKWSNGATTPSLSGLGSGGNGYFLTVTDQQGCSDVDFVHVYPLPNMIANAQVTQPNCGATGGGSISNVQVWGNYAPFTYTWPNGVSNQSLTGASAGTYTLTLTDANGCTLTQTFDLAQQNNLNLAMEQIDAKCAAQGGLARININSGTPPFQFNWNNGVQAQTNSGLVSGTYTVTVTDANGCTGVSNATVDVPSAITIDLVDSKGSCGNLKGGELRVVAKGGVEPYNYLWNHQNTQGPSITGVSSGSYTVTVTDANICTKSDQFAVPLASDVTASIVVSSANCKGGDNGTATVIAMGGTLPYSYQWNVQPVNTASINGLAGGQTVSVTVTDLNGCQGFASGYISIHQAIFLNATSTNVLCANGNNGTATAVATNGASPYQYAWNVPGLGVINGPTITNLTVGAYAVTTTDANGCTATSIANINNTDQVLANYALNTNGCADQVSVRLTDASIGATAWSWNVYSSTGILTFNTQNPGLVPFPNGTNGTIQLTVTSANGCTATTQQPFLIQGEVLNVTLSNNSFNACENTPQTITATNQIAGTNPTYQWYSSPAGLTFTNATSPTTGFNGPAGSYTANVIVTGVAGCKDTLSAPVVYTSAQPLNASAFSNDLCNGLEVDFNYTGTIPGTWTFGDGTTSTLNDPTHIYTAAGAYTVLFTPTAACTAPYTTVINVLATQAVNAGIQQAIVTCDSVAIFNFVSTSTPASGVTYAWNLGQGITSTLQNPQAVYNSLGPVTATLTVTDTKGCKDTATVTFPFHIINESIAPAQSFCAGASAVPLNPGTNSSYTYSWVATPPDATLVANAPNPMVQPTVPTTYTVSVTLGGCIITKTTTITPNAAAQLTPPPAINSCETGNVTVTASSTNGTVRWATNPAFTNPTIGNSYTLVQPITATQVYVQSTTAQGCINTDTIAVSVQPVNITFDTNNPINICAGASENLTITNTDPNDLLTYSWTGGLPAVANPSVAPTTASTYTVTVSNQFNCTSTASFSLNPISLAVSIDNLGNDTICPGETTQLQAIHGAGTFTYTWSPSSLVESGVDAQIATVTVNSNTEFNVTITDANGCTATNDQDVSFRELTCSRPFVFLPSAFTPNADDNNDRIMVRGVHIEELFFVIYDRWGEKMFQTDKINDLGWDGRFNGTDLSPDSYGYYFRVKCQGGANYEEKGNVTLLK
jgi:large repetitive protein